MYELSVTRLIDAPPARVWDAMVNRTNEWWCPRPWRAEMDFGSRQPGGFSMAVMHGPDGEVNEHPGCLLAWDEGRRFAMTDAVQEGLQPAGRLRRGTGETDPEGAGPLYPARARHWTSETMAHHREMGFEEGWGACADQLKALCEAG